MERSQSFENPMPNLNNEASQGFAKRTFAVIGVALAAMGANELSKADRANAYAVGTMSIENYPVDTDANGINDTVKTEIELGDFKKNEGTDSVRFELRSGPNAGENVISTGDVEEFFDGDSVNPSGWTVSPPYVGDPWTGKITHSMRGPQTEFEHYSGLSGSDQYGNFFINSINNRFNFTPASTEPPTDGYQPAPGETISPEQEHLFIPAGEQNTVPVVVSNPENTVPEYKSIDIGAKYTPGRGKACGRLNVNFKPANELGSTVTHTFVGFKPNFNVALIKGRGANFFKGIPEGKNGRGHTLGLQGVCVSRLPAALRLYINSKELKNGSESKDLIIAKTIVRHPVTKKVVFDRNRKTGKLYPRRRLQVVVRPVKPISQKPGVVSGVR